MPRLTLHTRDTAPADAKARLEAVQTANGFVPNLIGILANSPQALAMYQDTGKLNAQNSLSAQDIEVIQLVSARENGCDFCIAGHTKIAQKIGMDDALTNALRSGNKVSGVKEEALANFVVHLIDTRGKASDEALSTIKKAGYSDQNILDIVMGVALATLCNYTNNLAQTAINDELLPFAP